MHLRENYLCYASKLSYTPHEAMPETSWYSTPCC